MNLVCLLTLCKLLCVSPVGAVGGEPQMFHLSDPKTWFFVVLMSYTSDILRDCVCMFHLCMPVPLSSWLLILIRLSLSEKSMEKASHTPSPGSRQSIVSASFLFVTEWDAWTWVCVCHSTEVEVKFGESALSFQCGLQKSNSAHWVCMADAFTHRAILAAHKWCFLLECCFGTSPWGLVDSRP